MLVEPSEEDCAIFISNEEAASYSLSSYRILSEEPMCVDSSSDSDNEKDIRLRLRAASNMR